MGGRITGLLAAVFFLSTPMFFLGAGSALIDPLPVLGISLVLCTVIALEGGAVLCGVVQGLTLGCALWAHSQTVLFIPLSIAALALQKGWREPRAFFLQASVLLGIAGLIAAWPYGRNLLLFGSIISDNPAVFALKELRWAEYFAMARGLESWPEKIQYGIFKGWFALEAYALAFWSMSLGVALYLARLQRRHTWAQLRRGDFSQVPEHWLFVTFGIAYDLYRRRLFVCTVGARPDDSIRAIYAGDPAMRCRSRRQRHLPLGASSFSRSRREERFRTLSPPGAIQCRKILRHRSAFRCATYCFWGVSMAIPGGYRGADRISQDRYSPTVARIRGDRVLAQQCYSAIGCIHDEAFRHVLF